MSRRKAAPKRVILSDPKFKSELVAKFINCLMMHGKKSTAENIFYSALDILSQKMKGKRRQASIDGSDDDSGESGQAGSGSLSSTLKLFEAALDNIRPTVEVRSRRVGGATYQIPVEVRTERATALAMRWLIQAARGRGEKGFIARLAAEMLDALEKRGNAVKKREDTHRMAKANQAFAHYRW